MSDAAHAHASAPHRSARPILAVRGLGKRFTIGEQTVEALRDVNLTINKGEWESLPPDLKAIVENACAACNVISEAWCQRTNAEAMEETVITTRHPCRLL